MARRKHKERAKGRLLVIPKAGVTDNDLTKCLHRRGGLKSRKRMKGMNAHIYELPAGVDEVLVKKKLEKDSNIKEVLFDELNAPDDIEPLINSWAIDDTKANDVWEKYDVLGRGIDVAICDSGINIKHPLLKERVISQYNVTKKSTLAEDNTDLKGHGTKVAGAALNMAPGINLRAIRISERDDGNALTSAMANAIRYAADSGYKIINMSYSGTSNAIMRQVTKYARDRGCLVVFSAGNTGNNPNYTKDPNALVVAATKNNGTPASFSSYGEYVDLSAPGDAIPTTFATTGYGTVSGTSFSAPTVSGAAALLMEINNSLDPNAIEDVILDTVTPLDSKYNLYGKGKLNVLAAAEKLRPKKEPSFISFDNLVSGQEVIGRIEIKVLGSRDIDSVDLEINDGMYIFTDVSAPFSFILDTEIFENGVLDLSIIGSSKGEPVAYADLSVIVNNPFIDTEAPEINLFEVNPTDMGYQIRVGVVDDSEDIERISVKINDVVKFAAIDINPSLITSFDWVTEGLPEGDYVVQAFVEDYAGNMSESNPITVMIKPKPDTNPPVITNFDVIPFGKGYQIIVKAVDYESEEVARIEIRINGVIKQTVNDVNTLTYTWDTEDDENGDYVIQAFVEDYAGNMVESGRVTVVVEYPVEPEPEPVEPKKPEIKSIVLVVVNVIKSFLSLFSKKR